MMISRPLSTRAFQVFAWPNVVVRIMSNVSTGNLEELERRRGLKVGSIAIQLLIETAKGVINAYPSAIASKRVNSLIFGAVDYTKDMRVKLTIEGDEQFYARAHNAVAARAAGCIAIDCPFVAFKDTEAFEKNTRFGRQLGYEGRMLIHPSQIEPSHRIYTPSPEDVEWAKGVVKVFEEEGIAKGAAAVSYMGKMVDTPVYENARTILAIVEEIAAFDAKRKKGLGFLTRMLGHVPLGLLSILIGKANALPTLAQSRTRIDDPLPSHFTLRVATRGW